MWLPYHNTTTLHDNLVISYLRPLIPWYDMWGGEYPYLYVLMIVMVLPPSTLFFIKYLSLEFSLFLSNYAKYLIPENSCLAMKHDKSSLLQFPNYSRIFSSMHCYFQQWSMSRSLPFSIKYLQTSSSYFCVISVILWLT